MRPSLYGMSETEIYDEWDQLCSLAGLEPTAVEWPLDLAKEHTQNRRRYASVVIHDGTLLLANKFRRLHPQQRLGIYAHEIGHRTLLEAGKLEHTEKEADLAAGRVLRVIISYDKRWPGKGLQTASKAPENVWRVVDPVGVISRYEGMLIDA